MKAINPTSVAVSSEEIGGGTLQDQQSSCNSHRHQSKNDAQATRIATVRLELDKVLKENQKSNDMFNLDQLVEAMTKVVSTMAVKESPKTLQGTQYKSAFNYMGKLTAPIVIWCQWDAGAQCDLPVL